MEGGVGVLSWRLGSGGEPVPPPVYSVKGRNGRWSEEYWKKKSKATELRGAALSHTALH